MYVLAVIYALLPVSEFVLDEKFQRNASRFDGTFHRAETLKFGRVYECRGSNISLNSTYRIFGNNPLPLIRPFLLINPCTYVVFYRVKSSFLKHFKK